MKIMCAGFGSKFNIRKQYFAVSSDEMSIKYI